MHFLLCMDNTTQVPKNGKKLIINSQLKIGGPSLQKKFWISYSFILWDLYEEIQ